MRVNDRDTWLRVLALLVIGVLAGPEIGLAMEMTALLEVLGATAFFLTFGAGARMLAADLLIALRDYVCPPFLLRLRLPMVIVYAASRAMFVAAMGSVMGAYVLAAGLGELL